jgi:hypothetical protein
MKPKKLRVLMDLEMMSLGLIPFSVNPQEVIANWPEEKKKKFFRKFRKIARKAARHLAIREDRHYCKGTTAERNAWIKRRADFLFNRPSPICGEDRTPMLTGRKLQEYRFAKKRNIVQIWVRRIVWEREKSEKHD